MAEQTITLNPGESKVVSFEAIPQEARAYQVTVNGLTDSFRAIGIAGIEILRPNGAGAETGIEKQYPRTGAHWDKVDDVTPDEDDTRVYSYGESGRDLYTLENPTFPEDSVINKITLWIRGRSATWRWMGRFAFCIRTHYTTYQSGDIQFWTDEYYENFARGYVNNPYTGSPWTRDELVALQAGIYLQGTDFEAGRCTQVCVEVNYTRQTLT